MRCLGVLFAVFVGCANSPGVTVGPDGGGARDSSEGESPHCGGEGESCCAKSVCRGPFVCNLGTCGKEVGAPDGGDSGCPFALCDGVCANTQSDSANCGVCAHNCQGTLCSEGACLSKGIAVGTNPVALTVDATNVYFTDADGTVNEVPSSGGTVIPLASGIPSPYGVAVDATYVYFTNQGTLASDYVDGSILKVPIAGDGGAATVLATGRPQPQAIAVDATQVYWLEPGTTSENGALLSCPLSGCPSNTPHVMAALLGQPYGLALDATSVYVTASGGGELLGILKATDAVRTLAQMLEQPEGVAVSSGNVYWATNLDGVIWSVPVGGGESKFVAVTMGAPQAVAADGVNAYWSDTHPVLAFGSVETCVVTGCPPATPLKLIDPEQVVTNIAIDSLFVYLIDGVQILRVAK